MTSVRAGGEALTAEDALRAQVRAALTKARISQAEACRQLGVSTKHMCQMLTGRAPLTLDWAEQIAALCDMRIEVLVLTGTQPLMKGPHEGPELEQGRENR